MSVIDNTIFYEVISLKLFFKETIMEMIMETIMEIIIVKMN